MIEEIGTNGPIETLFERRTKQPEFLAEHFELTAAKAQIKVLAGSVAVSQQFGLIFWVACH